MKRTMLLLGTLAIGSGVMIMGSGTRGVAAPSPAPAPAGTQRFVIVPGESSVTYRVNETFINEGNRLNTAVGVTTVMRGEVFVDRARPASSRIGTITIDISQFTSDSARRDNAIRDRWLESRRFPLAEFSPTAVQGMPETYQDGREFTVQITGNLKIREAARPVTFASTIKLEGATLTVTGHATIKMTDFAFDPPSIFGILRAENEARLEFRFVARP